MSKSTFVVDEASRKQMQETHDRVRASMNPEQLAVAEESDRAFEEEKQDFEFRLESENKLRVWAEQLCGVKVDMSEIETISDAVSSLNKGEVYKFLPKRPRSPQEGRVAVYIYKTAFDTVTRLDSYIFSLEKTVIDLTAKVSPQYTSSSFFGLIKLAFKQLFTRSK